jgi:hypothetical protein
VSVKNVNRPLFIFEESAKSGFEVTVFETFKNGPDVTASTTKFDVPKTQCIEE